MATSTIFNFNFNNSEIVDSTGQWYDATTGTVTTEFINHDGNTALLQRAYIAETSYLRNINPVFFQSRDPTFTAHTYTIELQIYPLRDSGGFGPETGAVLDFNPDAADEENWVKLNTLQSASSSNTFYWREYGLGPDGSGIPFLTVTAADGTYNRWYSIRIERVDDGTNTGATVKIYVDGTLVVNETLTYAQDVRRGRIGDLIRYTYRQNSTTPRGAGVAIDNFKLTAGIAPSSVVDVSLANLQRNNANLLSFIKGKVPAVNDGTLTIQQNGTDVQTFTANASTNATANIQCVDLSTAQTVAGNKTFSGNTKFTSAATIEKSSGDVELLIKNPAVDATSVSANAVDDIRFTDSSDRITGSMRISYDTSNGVTAIMYARSYSADGSVSATNGISITSNQQTGAARASVSANLLPNSTDTYDLGSSALQWNNAYIKSLTINGAAAGDILTHNAAEFVDVSTAQTIAGDKTFTGTTTAHDVVPSATDTYNLGTSTNKWKTFNGINPGALSLPDVSSGYIQVDTTNFTWNTSWSYTPVFDGWISVWIPASAATKRRYSTSQEYLRFWYPNQNGEIFRFSFPVVKNVPVGFGFISDIAETVAPNIYLLKTQGNV